MLFASRILYYIDTTQVLYFFLFLNFYAVDDVGKGSKVRDKNAVPSASNRKKGESC